MPRTFSYRHFIHFEVEKGERYLTNIFLVFSTVCRAYGKKYNWKLKIREYRRVKNFEEVKSEKVSITIHIQQLFSNQYFQLTTRKGE